MQPVILGEGLPDIIVQPVDGFLGVGVLVDLPIAVVQILGKHSDGGADQRIGFPGGTALFPVENERFGGFGVSSLDQNLFDKILDAFHVGDTAGIFLFGKNQNLFREFFSQGEIITADSSGRFEDGEYDFFFPERNLRLIPFGDSLQH